MTVDIFAAFNQYFELVHADSEELRAHVYRLRFQVYVLETGFERADDCQQSQESDVYDRRSDHFLLRHRRTGIYAATTRLILPEPSDPCADFPIENHCELYPAERVVGIDTRQHLGEISRFAVSKDFKKRLGEARSIAGVAENVEMYFEDAERRVLPHLSLGLLAAVIRMVCMHDIRHTYAVMEPALIRLLGRFGVISRQIGSQVDYHGLRIPCLIDIRESLLSIKQVTPPLWELMTDRGRLGIRAS